MTAPVSVAVADGQRLFAEALVSALDLYPEIRALRPHPSTGRETVAAVVATRPDVLLLDCWIPGMQAAGVTAAIQARSPACRVVVLSWFYAQAEVEDVLDAGAAGFVLKNISTDQLLKVIQRSVAGQTVISPEVDTAELRGRARLVQRDISLVDHPLWQRRPGAEGGRAESGEVRGALASLTPREIEILEVLSRGWDLAQSAAALSITEKTLRNHIYNVCEKAGARSRAEAVRFAVEFGLIETRPVPAPPSPHRQGDGELGGLVFTDNAGFASPVDVLVGHAQRLFADALGRALGDQDGINVSCHRPTTAAEVVDLVLELQPQVAILDFRMEGMAEVLAAQDLAQTLPGCKVIFLSWVHDPEEIRQAIAAGAVGFLPKNASLVQVIDATRQAAAGHSLVFGAELAALSERITRGFNAAIARRRRVSRLTAREKEVLRALAEGRSVHEAARILAISPASVKFHSRKVTAKLDVGSMSEAVALARAAGFIN